MILPKISIFKMTMLNITLKIHTKHHQRNLPIMMECKATKIRRRNGFTKLKLGNALELLSMIVQILAILQVIKLV